MPHTPPIRIRELKKEGLLNEEAFFVNLQKNCNYVDEEVLRRFYMGLVKTVSQELTRNKVCRLPFLGDFALVRMKPKSFLKGKTREYRSAVVLRFYPKVSWRMYFNNKRNLFDGT